MLTDMTFKGYAGEIAALFCVDSVSKIICKAAVKQRIINSFTDETFENYFLPLLDKDRFYSFEIVSRVKSTFTETIKFKGFDIITGHNSPVYSKTVPKLAFDQIGWPLLLNPLGIKFINIMNGRAIIHNTETPYGFVFIIQEIDPIVEPGNGNGNGQTMQCPPGFQWFGGKCISVGVVPKDKPPAPPGYMPTPTEPGEGIIFNWGMWIVPAMIAGTAYYLYQAQTK